MMLYLQFIFFVFIYLILNNKWVLVESSENTQPSGTTVTSGSDGSSATPLPSSAGDGSSVKTDQASGIKLFGKDPNDANKTVELNTEQYDLKKLGGGNRIDYTFKDNAQCTLIKMDGKELWKHGDHKCEDYPTSVSYRYGDTIVIHLGNGFVQYIKSNNTWNVEFENNLKTSGDDTPDPSSQAQSETKTSGGGGTGTGGGGTGTDSSSGGGTQQSTPGSPTSGGGTTGTGGSGGSTETGGGGTGTGGGDGSGSPSGGTSYMCKDGDVTSGGGGPTAGGPDPGAKTGAADSAGKEKINESSSGKKKSSGGCGWFSCCCSK